MRAFAAAVLLSAVFPTAAHARARLAIRTSVVARAGMEHELPAVAIFDEAARVASFAPGLELIPRAELVNPRIDDALRSCGSDVTCIARTLRSGTRADLAISIVVDLAQTTPLVSVRLIDCGSAAIVGQELLEAEEREVLRAIADPMEALLARAGQAIGARISVELSPPNAKLSFDRDAVPDAEVKSSFFIALAEGQGEEIVRLSAASEGYQDGTLELVVRRGQETHASLRLSREPGLLESPWFWAGAALVVAAGVTATAVLAARDPAVQFCQVRAGGCDSVR